MYVGSQVQGILDCIKGTITECESHALVLYYGYNIDQIEVH